MKFARVVFFLAAAGVVGCSGSVNDDSVVEIPPPETEASMFATMSTPGTAKLPSTAELPSAAELPSTVESPRHSQDPTDTVTPVLTPEMLGNFPRGTLGDNDTVPEVVCSQVVTSVSALEDVAHTEMSAGTSVCLADGVYTDLELSFGGNGTEEMPITVAAANPGKVIFNGEVSVEMGGTYVVLQGFIFQDGASGTSEMIKTRTDNDNPCNHCRITEMAIIDMDVGDDDTKKWIYIYGQNNRVDHSWFSGKTTRGSLLTVDRWIPDSQDPATTEIDYAQIDHNYFGHRPPANGKAYAESSDNEYEAIRIGLSTSHTADSFSVVEHNYFERIEGEAEVISNKAGNNRIEHNTVRESYGSITNRHGSSATIANNFIIGDDHPFSGGLRIIDDGHTVINNYVEGVRFLDTTFHGGIVLTGADSSPSASGYQQVENVFVANNTIVDSVNSLNVFGGKKSVIARSVYLVNNIVVDAIGPVIVESRDGMPKRSLYAGNKFWGDVYADSNLDFTHGVTFEENESAQFVRDDYGIFRPSDASPDHTAVIDYDSGDFPPVTHDMDGGMRLGMTQAGADHISTALPTRGVLTKFDVGPIQYVPPEGKAHVKKVLIANHDFDSGLASWSVQQPVVMASEKANIFSRGGTVKIDGLPGRISQEVLLDQHTNYTLSAFTKGPASLSVAMDSTIESIEVNNNAFKFTRLSFNSGENTQGIISASLSENVTNFVPVGNQDFDEFDVSSDEFWMSEEGSAIGDVSSSSNTSQDPGRSAKLGYTHSSHSFGSPKISQTLTGLFPNTQYTLSMFVLQKNGSQATGTLGVNVGETDALIASKTVDYQALEDADAPEADEDGFLQDVLHFNSGNHTTVTIFFAYDAAAILDGEGQEGDLDSDTKKKNELRVDQFRLSYEGPPAAGEAALLDSFRLVSHGGIE